MGNALGDLRLELREMSAAQMRRKFREIGPERLRSLEFADASGMPLCHSLILSGDVAAAVALLEAGGGAGGVGPFGVTALHLAVRAGNPKVFDLLVREGADLDAADSQGKTALTICGVCAESDFALRLIGAGADPNIADKEGATAGHWAASRGDADVLEALLAAGWTPALPTRKGARRRTGRGREVPPGARGESRGKDASSFWGWLGSAWWPSAKGSLRRALAAESPGRGLEGARYFRLEDFLAGAAAAGFGWAEMRSRIARLLTAPGMVMARSPSGV